MGRRAFMKLFRCIIIQENHMTMTLVKQQSQTNPCAVFKAISKTSEVQAIPRKVTPYLQPIRVLLTVRFSFEYASLLILLARPSYFKQCLIFQQHKTHLIVCAHRPKAPRNRNPSLNAGSENFSPSQMGAQKIAALPQNLPFTRLVESLPKAIRSGKIGIFVESF